MKYLFLLFLLSCTQGPEPKVAPINKIQPLHVFVLDTMQVCKARLSEGYRDILAHQIARIAEERIPGRNQQEAFVLLVCIESKFNQSARSAVGAIGLTQLMPKLVPGFAKECGLKEVTASDTVQSEANLTIGACVFGSLLNRFNQNVTLSLAGYNSGPDSPTTKKMSALQMGHPETAGYVAAYAILREKMDGQK